MKDETSLEADTAPTVSAAKEERTDIKEEEAELPAQICSVKEEVIVSIVSQNTVLRFQYLGICLYCNVVFSCF